MSEDICLPQLFEVDRARLRALAYRMLGSYDEADDAVQEAWLRLARTDANGIDNLGGWLTTVVARVCLDVLRARKVRGEESWEPHEPEDIAGEESDNPEHAVQLVDSVGLALLVVLDTLSPAERVAFVLHDMFDLTFEQIAPILERTPTAARQLASRARRRVKATSASAMADRARQQEIVQAFLRASREGDFAALLTLLDPDIVLRADGAAVEMGATPEARGAEAVARIFAGRARVAEPAQVDGMAGLVWAHEGKPRVVFGFTVVAGRIVAIELMADAARLERFEIESP